MLDNHNEPAPLRLNNSARFSGLLVLSWGWLHVVNALSTWTFLARIGFWPIWYGDCVMCATPKIAPFGVPVIGGVGLFALLALVFATIIVLRVFPHTWQGPLQILAAVSCGVHAAIAATERFPGSLPQMLVGVVIPGFASVIFVLSYLRGSGPDRSSFASSRPASASVWFLLSALVSQLALGGITSLVAC